MKHFLYILIRLTLPGEKHTTSSLVCYFLVLSMTLLCIFELVMFTMFFFFVYIFFFFFWLFIVEQENGAFYLIAFIACVNNFKCLSDWFYLENSIVQHFWQSKLQCKGHLVGWKKEIDSRETLLRRNKEGLLASPHGSHFSVKWLDQFLIHYWSLAMSLKVSPVI